LEKVELLSKDVDAIRREEIDAKKKKKVHGEIG
jgi:hypothetical protein